MISSQQQQKHKYILKYLTNWNACLSRFIRSPLPSQLDKQRQTHKAHTKGSLSLSVFSTTVTAVVLYAQLPSVSSAQ